MNREDTTEVMRGKKWLREGDKGRRNSNKSIQQKEMRAVRIRRECVEGVKGEAVREVRKERERLGEVRWSRHGGHYCLE